MADPTRKAFRSRGTAPRGAHPRRDVPDRNDAPLRAGADEGLSCRPHLDPRGALSQPGGAEHFQEARALLEVGIARLAAQRCTDDDIVKLRRALDANIAARGDLERFERTDVAFHYVLATITRNPIYAAVHDGLVEWLTSQRTISLQVAGAEDPALEGHRQIFEGVARRDPEGAARAMEDHLASVAALIRRAMEGDDGQAGDPR